MGARYESITKETAGVLKGEYGAAPAPFNSELQARVLEGAEVITCRPADLLQPEMDRLTAELKGIAKEKGIKLATDSIDDVLTYARSEEHTSELQSLMRISYAVFCLKKKNHQQPDQIKANPHIPITLVYL